MCFLELSHIKTAIKRFKEHPCQCSRHIPMNTKVIIGRVVFGTSDAVNVFVFDRPANRLDTCINFDTMPGEFELDNQKFHIYDVVDEDLWVIFAENKMVEKTFFNYILTIKMALDFLHCETIGGNFYIISTDANLANLDYMKVLSSSPSNLNIQIFIKKNTQLENIFRKNNPDATIALTIYEFSKLCNFLYSTEGSYISTAVAYILESANLRLEYQPVLLSLVFEALSKTQLVNSKLVVDKEQFDGIKNEISNFIDTLNINTEIKTRLKNLLQNTLPYHQTLFDLFTKYGLDLTDEEKKIIKSRNIFMHGGYQEYSDNLCSDVIKFQKKSRIYYNILYRLILKIIGYRGYILDVNQWDRIQDGDNHYNDAFFANLSD